MRDETAEWLEPMLEALPDDVLNDLMARARMPAAEAAVPWADWMERALPSEQNPGMRHHALDWIRFGELLREPLGWADYADQPEGV